MHSTISEYVIKAREGDARRAGERDRLLLEVRRTRMTMHRRPSPVVRLTNLLFRRARATRRVGQKAQSTGSLSHTPARITVRPENSAGPFHT
jgi:hypothetical protein